MGLDGWKYSPGGRFFTENYTKEVVIQTQKVLLTVMGTSNGEFGGEIEGSFFLRKNKSIFITKTTKPDRKTVASLLETRVKTYEAMNPWDFHKKLGFITVISALIEGYFADLSNMN